MSTSFDLLTRSNEYWIEVVDHLEKGNLEKASELTWGSIAELIKALALRKHNYEIKSHREIRGYVKKIATQLGDREMYDLFCDVEDLHRNFYDGLYDEAEVRIRIDEANRLILKINKLL